MFDICTACGLPHTEPELDEAGSLVCPSCGDRRAFRRLPLLLVGGPAGAGKSTVGASLLGEMSEAVLIESDLLWRREFNTPEDGYNNYFRLGLRLPPRPSARSGAGFAGPPSGEPLPERRLFKAAHYLGLVCDDEALVARLRARPKWRNTTPELVAEHVEFNRWLKEHAATTAPPVTLLDTTSATLRETTAQVAAWIRLRVSAA